MRIIWLLFFLILISCSKDEFAARDYPRLNTLDVIEITSTGAKFNAEIISGDLSSITEYGFTWNEYVAPRVENHDHIIFQETLTGVGFSHKTGTLKSGQIYYVRSFVRTNEHLIYGPVISFRTLK